MQIFSNVSKLSMESQKGRSTLKCFNLRFWLILALHEKKGSSLLYDVLSFLQWPWAHNSAQLITEVRMKIT